MAAATAIQASDGAAASLEGSGCDAVAPHLPFSGAHEGEGWIMLLRYWCAIGFCLVVLDRKSVV